ncbi:hypothetical protein EV2_009520 [Malus domestica]
MPPNTRAYKLLDQETKEKKIKEYYRQYQFDYFWLIPKTGSMAIELVLSSDSTSLCVDGAIDAKLVDAAFYIMSENETNEGREPNLYISSYIFNNTEMERPKSDVEYLDQRLKRILGENMDKVGKVFIPMKHYFHVTLIVWVIQK